MSEGKSVKETIADEAKGVSASRCTGTAAKPAVGQIGQLVGSVTKLVFWPDQARVRHSGTQRSVACQSVSSGRPPASRPTDYSHRPRPSLHPRLMPRVYRRW